jgi:hypothetical protein
MNATDTFGKKIMVVYKVPYSTSSSSECTNTHIKGRFELLLGFMRCLMSESDDEDSDSANVGDERDFLEKKKRGNPHVGTPIARQGERNLRSSVIRTKKISDWV